MSTALTNTFEGGTDGAFLTAANSATSGTAFSHVVSNNVSVGSGNGNIVYQSDITGRGALACKMTVTAASSYLRMPFTETGTRYVARRWLYLESTPSANFVIVQLYAGSSLMGSLQVTSARKIQAYRASTSLSTAGLTTAVLAESKGYWVEFAITPESGGGGNGIVEFALFDSDGTTLLESKQVSAQATTTSVIDAARFGGHGTASGMVNDYIDDVRIEAKTSGWIGASANIPPTVVQPPNQTVGSGGAVSLSFIANDPDGVIVSRATSFDFPTTGAPTITGGTTSTPSFTAGAAGNLYIVRHTVTDNAGATASTTTEVRVPTAGALRPLAMDGTGAGTWTKTGPSTDGGSLLDELDSSYIESQTLTSTPTTRRIRYQPSTTRSALTFTERLGVDTGTGNMKFRVFDGTTMRQEWTQAVTATPTDYTFTLTSPAAVADWGYLSVEYEGSI